MNIKKVILEKARNAKAASRKLANLSTDEKNKILIAMADAIEQGEAKIIAANKKDLVDASKSQMSTAKLDRLKMDSNRIASMGQAMRKVVELPDPVGETIKQWTRPNGLEIAKVRVPIGVIGIIYEARPNVTADVAGLCIKTGNAVILRGGSEAYHSNKVIAEILEGAGEKQKMPRHSVQLIESKEREAITEMLKLDEYVDLIIPRGGEGLIKTVVEHSTIPVIKHYKGICHTFVDRDADLGMAERIVLNAKVQRPGVCNAMETMLVHEGIAQEFLPYIIGRFHTAGVEIRGCHQTKKIVNNIKAATEEDWATEHLDLILSVKVVKNVEEAIEHINRYGSMHSDAIVTNNNETAARFLGSVDSSSVYVNASTRFTDGGEFGLGAEMGISTDKLHARGPMGLEELTSYKYIIKGDGQIRE